MKALVAAEYGGYDVLRVGELPVPEPGAGQIQVRIAAAGLNPADLMMLSGLAREMVPLEFPIIPGQDFAGTVTKLGSGVTRFAVGDEVFGQVFPTTAGNLAKIVADPPSLGSGPMAEYAVFAADTPELAIRPAELTAERAATLATAGLTALPLLRAGAFAGGETVLVTGATGGVATALIPLLAKEKVRVIATATAADKDYVRNLGAAVTIDYKAPDYEAQLAKLSVDAVLNLVLPGTQLAALSEAVKPGGKLLSIVFPPANPAGYREDLTVENIMTSASAGELEKLAAYAVDGTIPGSVSRQYGLANGAQAYADLKTRHTTGKLVVVM
jgi:NADPH:quinone reductase-like Zn-dependent oxidoreductase